MIQSQNEKTTLLGKTKQDYASILKWLSYFNVSHLLIQKCHSKQKANVEAIIDRGSALPGQVVPSPDRP